PRRPGDGRRRRGDGPPGRRPPIGLTHRKPAACTNMAVNAETAAITRALIALITSLGAIERALLELAPSQARNFRDHIEAAQNAREDCLQRVKRLVELMEKNHE